MATACGVDKLQGPVQPGIVAPETMTGILTAQERVFGHRSMRQEPILVKFMAGKAHDLLIHAVLGIQQCCGFGLGLYGQLERFELYYVVAGVWAFILLWSRPWLAAFHYGPFEWLWRSLVMWKPQPFRRRPGDAAAAA